MRSGRRQEQPDNENPTFFLDRSLGRVHVARALRERGIRVVLMVELYPDGQDQQTGDDTWICDVSDLGYVALTKDSRLIRDHLEALHLSTLRLFTIDSARITGPAMADRVDRHLNRVLQRARKHGPYAYVLHDKRVELRWRPER